MTIMCGDALTIFIALKQGADFLTPVDVADLEACIGPGLRRTYREGGIGFSYEQNRWSLRLSQEDTFALGGRSCSIVLRVKFGNAPDYDVRGMKLGILDVVDTVSQEVL